MGGRSYTESVCLFGNELETHLFTRMFEEAAFSPSSSWDGSHQSSGSGRWDGPEDQLIFLHASTWPDIARESEGRTAAGSTKARGTTSTTSTLSMISLQVEAEPRTAADKQLD